MPTAVWDPLLRVFHWSLASFFFVAYLLEGGRPVLHSHAGYTVALLVMFRLIWGFIGPRHARWADFMPSPGTLSSYIRCLLRRQAEPYVGHDPAGAAMIVALLVGLASTAFTGTVLFAMEGSGPLAGTVVTQWHGGTLETVHGWCADITLVLVIVHVCGVLFTSHLHKQNLIAAMFSGRKTAGGKSAS